MKTTGWRSALAVAWLGACALAAPAGAAEPALPAPEVFYREADIVHASLSPSGTLLAIATGVDRQRVALAVVDIERGNTIKVTARLDNSDIRDFHWVADDQLVFTLVDMQAGGGWQRFAQGLFAVRPDGSGVRRLVKPLNSPTGDTAVTERSLSWNHVLLDVPRARRHEVVVGRLDTNGAKEVVNILPFALDTQTQRLRNIADGAPSNATGWLFDPQGNPRVAIVTREGETRIHWRGDGDAGWRQIARFPQLQAAFTPRFVDGAGQLFVTTATGAAGWDVLRRFDFAANAPEAEPLVSTPGYDFTGSIVIDADAPTGKALGVRVLTDAETTVWFDPRLRQWQQAVDARLPGRVNRVTCRRCSGDDPVLLVQSWSDREPGELWIHRPRSGAWQGIGRARPDVDAKRMGLTDLHRVRMRDGLEIPVWVTQPAERSSRPRPAVVLVHGGPWVRGRAWEWSDDAQFLASRGYVVIEPEFRGSEGYGRALFQAGWKQWGQAMQDDLVDATRWAAGRGWVDAERVCVAGASYGGYATLMALVRDHEVFRCGVAWAAVTDPRLLFGLDWVNDIPEDARRYPLPLLIGDPKADAAALEAVAPLAQAARIRRPVLLAFGGRDRRVPIEHGTRLRDAMKAAGLTPEWIVYPEESHGWLVPANRFDFARRMEAFLEQHLKR